MEVFVLNKHKKPLMPCSPRKARLLLKQNKAIVVKQTPFTIQLLYGTSGYTQPITLKVDSGSKGIGISCVCNTTKKELYSGEVELRNDIVELLSTRRELRSARRNRKTRYRKPRFLNRKASKQQGWVAPSINQKIDTHISCIKQVYGLLPISKLIVETASFDIQKIKNPTISGKEYQQGDMLDFWNVREYVLFRDGHTCQCCKCKPKKSDTPEQKKMRKVLNVHHIESRKVGGNAPNNLITLCEICHSAYHQGLIQLPKTIKRGIKFNDAAFMGIMRWSLFNRLIELYGKDNVSYTFGYITKNNRIANDLPKAHRYDALCIGEPNAKEIIRADVYYYQKKVRCHNRQIHKNTIQKGGKRKLNQAPYLVKGFRLFDKVLYKGQVCFIFGRRSSGYFDLRLLDGTSIHKSANAKDLILLETRKSYLVERRKNDISNKNYLQYSS